MKALVGLLPVAWQAKAKAVVAGIGVIVGALILVFPTLPDWASTLVAALTALGVYAAPSPGYVAPEPAQHSA